MRAFIKNVGVILILIICCSMTISAISLWALRNSSFYKPSFLVNDVKEQTFDYVILGASTGLTTLNTNIIDSMSNTRGLNLSMDDSALATHYLMLQHFIAEGKSASFCILAPSNTSYDLKVNRLSGNDYRFLPYVDRDYVYDYYNLYKNKESQILRNSKFLPMLGVSYYNSELFYPSINSLFNPKKRNRFDANGNYSYPAKNIQNHPNTNRDTFDVDFSNIYMKAIKTLCEKNDIQLICYFTPMEHRSANVVNMDYIVINHSAYLNNKRYFFDGIHVNSLGREIVSRRFAEELKVFINEK